MITEKMLCFIFWMFLIHVRGLCVSNITDQRATGIYGNLAWCYTSNIDLRADLRSSRIVLFFYPVGQLESN